MAGDRWWIGLSCSRPTLSLLVLGGGGRNISQCVVSAVGSAAAKGELGRAGITPAIHAAERPDAVVVAGPLSVDAVVVVGTDSEAQKLARLLPPELRTGRTILLVDHKSHVQPAAYQDPVNSALHCKLPVIKVDFQNELDVAMAGVRICRTFTRLLGLDVGIPSLHYLP